MYLKIRNIPLSVRERSFLIDVGNPTVEPKQSVQAGACSHESKTWCVLRGWGPGESVPESGWGSLLSFCLHCASVALLLLGQFSCVYCVEGNTKEAMSPRIRSPPAP